MYYFCVHNKRNYKISRKISSEIVIESFVFQDTYTRRPRSYQGALIVKVMGAPVRVPHPTLHSIHQINTYFIIKFTVSFMRIRILQVLLGLMMMAPMVTRAADGDKVVDVLVLKMADETTELFVLDDHPTITLADGKFTVTSASVNTDYNLSDVTEYYFEKVDTMALGVEKLEKANFTLTYTDNTHVRVTGTKARVAQLYSLVGQLLTTRPTTNGTVTMSLAECKPGVYVLRLENNRSIKIIRK